MIVNKWFFRVPAGMSSKPPFDSSNPFQPSPTWRIIPFSKELGSPPSSAIWKGCITTRSRKGTYIITMVINHRLNQVLGPDPPSSSDPSLTAAWNGTCWKPFFFFGFRFWKFTSRKVRQMDTRRAGGRLEGVFLIRENGGKTLRIKPTNTLYIDYI